MTAGAAGAGAAAREGARCPRSTAVPPASPTGRRVVVAASARTAAGWPPTTGSAGSACATAVPPTWLHVLTFPLHIAPAVGTGLDRSRSPGSVHVTNRMRLHRPVVGHGERWTWPCASSNLRPHRRGVLLDLVGEVGSATSWSGTGSAPTSRRARRSVPGTPASSGSTREGFDPGHADRAPGGCPPTWAGDYRRRLRRPQPDPHQPARGAGVRLRPSDHPRHVDPRPPAGGAGTAAARHLRGRGRLRPADPAAVKGRRLVASGRRRLVGGRHHRTGAKPYLTARIAELSESQPPIAG